MASLPLAKNSMPAGSAMDRYLFFPLLCLYVTIVQFGSLMRLSDFDKSFGLSTVVVIILVILGTRKVVWALISERIFWVLGALVFYLIIPSVLAREPIATLAALFQVSCYVLLAAAISRTHLSDKQVFLLLVFIGGGLFLSAALTVVDFAGIVDVPRNNNLWISTKVGAERVEQASGFFPRRSAMAAVFSIGIASSLVLALGHSSVVVRLGFLAVGCTGLLCVFLTHNRSGVFGPLAVIAVYALVSPRFRGVRRIGMLISSVLIGMCLLLFIVRYYPEHASVYVAKLGFLGLAEKTWESDHLRIDLFIAAIKAMGSTPLGNGFSLVKLPSGISMNAHNVVTAIIWGAGIFSLVWLPIFAATVYSYFGPRLSVRRSSRPPIPIEYEAVACALFSWLAGGMTHNILQTGVAWLLFGVLISNRYFNSRSSIQSASASKATRAGRDTDTRISKFGSPATGGG